MGDGYSGDIGNTSTRREWQPREGISSAVVIRPETSVDQAAIARVNREAFGRDDEARLVDLLRQQSPVIASLVAVDDSGQVIGHILFSPATILLGSNELQVASLAPMAVVPSLQRRGIGSMLVERGLHDCKQAGYRAAIVVGHPNYYPRFGFSHALVASLENPFANGDAFMGMELARGSLTGLRDGRIVYPQAFNRL
jgi:putative acetyltransferase